jgi:hypothetical protein
LPFAEPISIAIGDGDVWATCLKNWERSILQKKASGN